MVNINPFQKAQHTAPKMEDIKLNVPMAITLNPIKEHDPTKPIMCFITSQYNYLQQHSESGGYKLLLYPEASPTAKIHFHGYLIISDIHKWIQKGCILLKDLNSFAIKLFFNEKKDEVDEDGEPKGEEKWKQYCTKQQHIFKPLFESNVLDYPLNIGYTNTEGEGGAGTEGAAPPPSSHQITPRPRFQIQDPKQKRKTKIIIKAESN